MLFLPGLPVSFPVESMLFRPPPRITLKLKMPKVLSLGNGKTSSKCGNGPLCPDNSVNVHEHSVGGLGLGKPQLHPRGRRDERSNGLLSSSSHSHRDGGVVSSPTFPIKPTGKPLALHAALHGHSSNGNGKVDQERARSANPTASWRALCVRRTDLARPPVNRTPRVRDWEREMRRAVSASPPWSTSAGPSKRPL